MTLHTATLPENGSDSSRLIRYGSYAFAALLVLVALYCRIRLLSVPLERDEGGFAYIGQQLLKGVPPYASGNMKNLAGIDFAYAAIMWLFGESAAGIHMGLLLVNATSMVLLFFLARRLFAPEGAAVSVGVFAILSASQTVLGVFAHATQFVVMFVLAGLIALLAGLDGNRRRYLFVSGVFLGCAVLMKQHAVFFCLFALAYAGWGSGRAGGGYRGVLRHLSVIALGIFAPYAANCVYMLVEGVFREFWFWTVTYSLEYAGGTTFGRGESLLVHELKQLFDCGFGFWLLGGLGLLLSAIPSVPVRHRWFVPLFFLFGLISITPGMHFYNHYFVLLLPSVALLAGFAFVTLPSQFSSLGKASWVRLILLGLFVLAGASRVYGERDYLFTLSPNAVSREIYGLNPFPESVEIARYVKAHTAPGTEIAILGSEPQIYFYADRPSATDYLYMYSIAAPQEYVKRMQREMFSEIEAERPAYVVFVGVPTSWMFRGGERLRIIKWIDSFLSRYYTQVGLVELGNSGVSTYYWGKNVAHRLPASEFYVGIFERTLGNTANR